VAVEVGSEVFAATAVVMTGEERTVLFERLAAANGQLRSTEP
jgi:hypothetical protein